MVRDTLPVSTSSNVNFIGMDCTLCAVRCNFNNYLL